MQRKAENAAERASDENGSGKRRRLSTATTLDAVGTVYQSTDLLMTLNGSLGTASQVELEELALATRLLCEASKRVEAEANYRLNGALLVFNLPSTTYVKLLGYLDYETIDRLRNSSARFADILDTHLEKLPRRQINSVKVFDYGYFDGAVASTPSPAHQAVLSPSGESSHADVVITEYRSRPVSNQQAKYRRVFRGEASTVASVVAGVLRHAEIRVLSFHGFKLDLQWAQAFGSLPAFRDNTTEVTIRESELMPGALPLLLRDSNGVKRLSLDHLLIGLQDLDDSFMQLCAQRGIQQLVLEPEAENMPGTFSQAGLLNFCFEGKDCAMRSLRISGNVAQVIDEDFVPLFIEAYKHSAHKGQLSFQASLADGISLRIPAHLQRLNVDKLYVDYVSPSANRHGHGYLHIMRRPDVSSRRASS